MSCHHLAAASESGHVWVTPIGAAAWRRVAGCAAAPRGLLPSGGCAAQRLVLAPLPDCCAAQREGLRAFALTHSGRRLPADTIGVVSAFVSHPWHTGTVR
eukprot:TRINITY_DN43270_c0_g1_i2.p3 TRINITY_DN43270_c0_g1~~TRINITY_DN43270_c0_g1_i2.p3  ORF type:complete len:112 (+),score=20.68 TRINITY_DN43270_c0_g1_i2:37-336(+)